MCPIVICTEKTRIFHEGHIHLCCTLNAGIYLRMMHLYCYDAYCPKPYIEKNWLAVLFVYHVIFHVAWNKYCSLINRFYCMVLIYDFFFFVFLKSGLSKKKSIFFRLWDIRLFIHVKYIIQSCNWIIYIYFNFNGILANA